MIFLKRRRREVAVANAMIAALVAKSETEIVPPDAIAHEFGVACEASNFMPDQQSVRRILANVSRDIAARRRAADELNATLIQSTEELQRRAKR